MNHRKLIAFACSLLLTLCGTAVAQQGIGWHFDMMRGSGGGAPKWVNPDPNADRLVFWMSFDNLPVTNSLGKYIDDGPYKLNATYTVTDSHFHLAAYTNALGAIDYAMRPASSSQFPTHNQTNLWAQAVSAKPFNSEGITLHMARKGVSDTYETYINVVTASGDFSVTNTTSLRKYEDNYRALVMSNATAEVSIYGGGTLTVTNEYVIAMSYSSNNCRLYKNGIQIGVDASCTSFPYNNLVSLSWGMLAPNTRDIRIYNKALSSQEVYNAAMAMVATNNLWAKPVNVVP